MLCTILAREAADMAAYRLNFVDFCAFFGLCRRIRLDFGHTIPWPFSAVDF
jgi:hypothetical protein